MRTIKGDGFQKTAKKNRYNKLLLMEVLHIVPVDGNVCGRNKDYTGRSGQHGNKESR